MFDELSDEQFAIWFAGFFEGEGCVYIPKKPFGICVTVANTQKDVIFGIHQRLACGGVSAVNFANKTWKTKYVWESKRYEDALRVLHLLRPYLFIKAEKADEAIQRIEGRLAFHQRRLDRNQEIYNAVKSGMLQKDAAVKFGVHKSNVSYICRRIERGAYVAPRAREFSEYTETHVKTKVNPKTSQRLLIKS